VQPSIAKLILASDFSSFFPLPLKTILSRARRQIGNLGDRYV
jgi:hypothetical protein